MRDVVVRYAEDTVAIESERTVSFAVVRSLLIVYRPVDFDDEACARTREVDDKTADGHLATEPYAERIVTKHIPQHPLSGRERTSQFTRPLSLALRHARPS